MFDRMTPKSLTHGMTLTKREINLILEQNFKLTSNLGGLQGSSE